MKHIKKIMCTALAVLMLCITSFANTIYENKTETEITRGVTHTYIEKIVNGSWQKINVICANLNDENVSVTPLYDSRGISYKNTLSSLAAQGGAVAAVNADFFDTTTPSGRTSPIGISVKEGEVITTSSHEPWYAAIAKTSSGMVADYFKSSVYLHADNGNKMQIIHINKYHSTQSIVMFTKDFGSKTPPNTDESVEMVVIDNKVSSIDKTGDTPIPENGYILKVNPAVNNFFAENFEVGDSVKISVEITPDFGEIEMAVGGGTLLVKNGSVAEFTHNVSGNHPRSAAGISKDGSKLYLVTVEGREDSTPGMSQKELANLMISLGCHSAINFDGGGSTEMVVRNDFGEIKVANTPSDGGERHISTGLGVKSAGQNPYFASMKLSASKENVFVGDYVEIWATPFDNYKNPTVIGNDLNFSADDGGRFIENKYYPNTPGVRTVTVSYENVTSQITINVMQNIENLTFYPATFEGSSGYLSLIAADENGFKSQISPDSVIWQTVSGKGSVSGGSVSANGPLTLSASFAGKTVQTTVNDNYVAPYIYDKFKTTIEKPDFIIVPSHLSDNTFLNKIINAKTNYRISKAPTSFTTGTIKGAQSLDSLGEKSISGTKLVTVRNDLSLSKGISSWKSFLNLEYAAEKNIIIYLAGGREFSDTSTNTMFDKTLKKLYNNGKNVFVVFCADMPYADVHQGARFISIRKNPEILLDNFSKTFDSSTYIKFKTDGNNLYYEISKLFE